jgi:intracellular septation protein
MQLLFDFLPVIAFFVAYKIEGIYVATVVIIVATVLQVSIHWLRTRRVNPMHLASAGLVLLFGGLTLLIHDSTFIKWKPTVLYWLLAAAFALSSSRRVSEKPLVQRMTNAAGGQIELSSDEWRRLNWTWAGFLVFLGAANLAVFKYFSENAWVNFKLVMIGMLLVFVLAQGFWIAMRARDDEKPAS